jgi:hypothetical protein
MLIQTRITDEEFDCARANTSREKLAKRLNISDRRAGELLNLVRNGNKVTERDSLKDYRKWLLFGDLHGEYADESVLGIIDEVIADWEPDRVVLAGDAINCDWASKYTSSSKVSANEEFEMLDGWLTRFGVTDYLEGNHEARLTRQATVIPSKMSELFDIPTVLNLKRRGINWYPYQSNRGGVLNIGKLKVVHGWWYNKYCAAKHAEAYGCVAFFHTHRCQDISSLIAGEKLTGFAVGCCCQLHLPYDLDLPPREHMQAFATVYEHIPTGNFTFHTNRLIGDSVVIEGREYVRK